MDSHTRLRHWSGQVMDAAGQVNASLMDAPAQHERRTEAERLKLLQDASAALNNAFLTLGERSGPE